MFVKFRNLSSKIISLHNSEHADALALMRLSSKHYLKNDEYQTFYVDKPFLIISAVGTINYESAALPITGRKRGFKFDIVDKPGHGEFEVTLGEYTISDKFINVLRNDNFYNRGEKITDIYKYTNAPEPQGSIDAFLVFFISIILLIMLVCFGIFIFRGLDGSTIFDLEF